MTYGVNLKLAEMGAILSHERRVAVPFYRDERKVAYLQFEPAGPVLRELSSDSFKHTFTKTHDEPVLGVVLKFVGAVRTCYLPGSRVMPTLMEIFNMAITNGNGDLQSLSQAELTAAYNQLAEAAKKPVVKSFKDKATAIKRITELQGDVSQLTPKQAEAVKAADEKEQAKPAAKKAAAKKEEPKNLGQHVAVKKAAKAKPVAAKKTAAKAKPAAEGEKKQRGQGIGAFACERILAGRTNEQVLEDVLKKFPGASTSASSVAWYRNKLKSEGKLT